MRHPRKFVLALAAAGLLAGTAQADTGRSAGAVIDDAAITASLKAKLIGDKDTKARQIDIETRNGVVELTGFVDSAAASAEAERLAAGTNGVKSVANNLKVRADDRSTGEVLDDGGLSARVNAALAADARTSAMAIDVAVRDGDVQLGGFVKNAREKSAAEEVARGVSGVRTVSNALKVR